MRAALRFSLFAVIIVVIFSGCGGDQHIGYQILTGDYFPLDEDRQWDYDVRITTYVHTDEVTANTTADRIVTEHATTTAAGTELGTAICTTVFAAVPAPDIVQNAPDLLARYGQFLFSPEGGLRPWNEHFTVYDRNSDGTADRIVRTAGGPPGGAIMSVPSLQPFLPVPTYTGLASHNSQPLAMLPFYTNNTTLQNSTTILNVQRRDPDDVVGDGSYTEFTSLVETMQATIVFDGQTGACTGKAITDIARDYGPVRSDIDLEFRLADHWLRLWITMQHRP